MSFLDFFKGSPAGNDTTEKINPMKLMGKFMILLTAFAKGDKEKILSFVAELDDAQVQKTKEAICKGYLEWQASAGPSIQKKVILTPSADNSDIQLMIYEVDIADGNKSELVFNKPLSQVNANELKTLADVILTQVFERRAAGE
jgi:hypothetical protein